MDGGEEGVAVSDPTYMEGDGGGGGGGRHSNYSICQHYAQIIIAHTHLFCLLHRLSSIHSHEKQHSNSAPPTSLLALLFESNSESRFTNMQHKHVFF